MFWFASYLPLEKKNKTKQKKKQNKKKKKKKKNKKKKKKNKNNNNIYKLISIVHYDYTSIDRTFETLLFAWRKKTNKMFIIFSRRHFEIFFLFSPESRLYISCKTCMKY